MSPRPPSIAGAVSYFGKTFIVSGANSKNRKVQKFGHNSKVRKVRTTQGSQVSIPCRPCQEIMEKEILFPENKSSFSLSVERSLRAPTNISKIQSAKKSQQRGPTASPLITTVPKNATQLSNSKTSSNSSCKTNTSTTSPTKSRNRKLVKRKPKTSAKIQKTHEDSSQLQAALLGSIQSGDAVFNQNRTMTATKHLSLLERKKKQWEEERSSQSKGFWGRPTPQDESAKSPIPTCTAIADVENGNKAQDTKTQSLTLVTNEDKNTNQSFHPVMMNSPAPYPQCIPFQMPMNLSGGGFGNGPVYFIMPPQTGVSSPGSAVPPHCISMPLAENGNPTSLSQFPVQPVLPINQVSVPQSASSSSSSGSGWSEGNVDCFNQRMLCNKVQDFPWNNNERVNSRAKWGEKGQLWTSSNSPAVSRRPSDALPPSWVDVNTDNPLPGAPYSRPCERTHARGAGIRLEPEEIAERQRKMKQAEETQRVIKMQLEEKKRQKAEEEERERKEAEMWEERAKIQKEKEAREYEEELRKKREKEEAEERKQQQMKNAIKVAADKAKKEKESMKPIAFPLPSDEPQSARDTSSENQEPQEPQNSQKIRKSTKETVTIPSSPRNDNPKAPVFPSFLYTDHNGGTDDQLKTRLIPAGMPVAGVLERLRLLQSIGITPDYLISSGLLDRSAILALLGANSSGLPHPVNNLNAPLSDDYVRDRIVTPTKYRNRSSSRDFGTQWEEANGFFDRERRASRRRSRRASSPSRSSVDDSKSDARPQWGRHQSDRPYRKQSEKDPFSNRKLRRRQMRSVSPFGERESATESETGEGQSHRRGRKRWDKSRHESLSSDYSSRSPSPGVHRRGQPSPALPSGMPKIRQPLVTTVLHRLQQPTLSAQPCSPRGEEENTEAISRSQSRSPNRLAPPSPAMTYLLSPRKSASPPPARSNSPPVPALQSKKSGEFAFNVPEYPPDASHPDAVRSGSPPVPAVAKRLLQLPDLAPPTNEESQRHSAHRRASLAGTPRTDEPKTRPRTCSVPTQKPPSPFPNSGAITRTVTPVMSRPCSPNRLPPVETDGVTGRKYSKVLSLSESNYMTPVETTTRLYLDTSLPSSASSSSSSAKDLSARMESENGNRRGSTNSIPDEALGRTMSVTSSGYESGNRSSGELRSTLNRPLVSQDKWNVLQSLSSLKQNLRKRQQEMSVHPESDGSS